MSSDRLAMPPILSHSSLGWVSQQHDGTQVPAVRLVLPGQYRDGENHRQPCSVRATIELLSPITIKTMLWCHARRFMPDGLTVTTDRNYISCLQILFLKQGIDRINEVARLV